jgi:Primase X
MNSRAARAQMVNSPATIWWIEKLLQTPIDDYRKYAVWRILVPYLVNIRRLAGDEANNTIKGWLDKCNSLRRLDFNSNYVISRNIRAVKKDGYLPIGLDKLKTECTYLYRIVTLGQCSKS